MKSIALLILVLSCATAIVGQSRRPRVRLSRTTMQSKVIVAKDAQYPVFSSDGTKIAFIGKSGTIWIKDIRRKTLREVHSQYQGKELSWSPDGKTIAFARYGPPKKEWVQLLNGSRMQQEKIGLSIWLIDINGKNVRQLIEPATQGDQYPCWSPDGKYIVLSHGDPLWIVNADGSNPRPFTLKPAKTYEHCIAWSRTGDLVAYYAFDDPLVVNDYRISTVNSNGDDQKLLSKDIDGEVKWSRDTKSLYYLTSEVTTTGAVKYSKVLWKIDVGGSRPAQKLIDLPFDTDHFDISPDEKWVVYDDVPEGCGAPPCPPERSAVVYMRQLRRR